MVEATLASRSGTFRRNSSIKAVCASGSRRFLGHFADLGERPELLGQVQQASDGLRRIEPEQGRLVLLRQTRVELGDLGPEPLELGKQAFRDFHPFLGKGDQGGRHVET